MPKESESLETLRAARVRAVQTRRELAGALARSPQTPHGDIVRKDFIEVQDLIEAIDRAIEDEESSELSDVLGYIPGVEDES